MLQLTTRMRVILGLGCLSIAALEAPRALLAFVQVLPEAALEDGLALAQDNQEPAPVRVSVASLPR